MFKLFFVVLLFSFQIFSQNERLIIKTEKPGSGKTFEFVYNPAGGPLESSEDITFTVFYFGETDFFAEEIFPEKVNNEYHTSFVTDKKASGFLLRINEDDIIDNNNKKGFPVLFYNENGEIAKYAYGGLADAFAQWGEYFAGLERNTDSALYYYEKEVNNYPELNNKYNFSYLLNLFAAKGEEAVPQIKSKIEEYEKLENLSTEQLLSLFSIYNRMKESEKAMSYIDKIKEQDPKGNYVQNQRYRSISSEKDVNKKLELLEQFLSDFPDGNYTENALGNVLSALIGEKRFGEAKNLIEKYDGMFFSTSLNTVAWGFAEKKENLEFATFLALEGIKIARSVVESPKKSKPAYMTKTEFKNSNKNNLAMVLDTYGYILLLNGNNEDALKYIEEAYVLSNGKDGDINNNYVEVLIKTGNNKKAIEVLTNIVSAGNGNEELKLIFKELYKSEFGNDKDFEKKYTQLEAPYFEKLRKQYEGKLISEPAPKFSLVDLSGNSVKLEDYKGKVVIIDFWATWCGPCISSFPGLQKTVNNYKDANDVQFLFINSWENVADKKKNASDFMNKNNYSLYVLMDEDNSVISSFKVDGIPTKFVIDKNGNIRFKSVGFSGSTDKLVTELTMMIEMVR